MLFRSVVSQAKAPVLVRPEGEAAVWILKSLSRHGMAEIIGDVGVLRRVFVDRRAAGVTQEKGK